MSIVNLVCEERGDVRYSLLAYPDGQQDINVGEVFSLAQTIYSRLNSWNDLELIVCTVEALRDRGVQYIELWVPYFLGARSDRKFRKGSANYLKRVICPVINSLKLNKVTVLDPHSDVLEACLDNVDKKDNSELFQWAFPSLTGVPTIVSPDAGALKKVYNLIEATKYQGDLVIGTKHRDGNGKLTDIRVDGDVLHKECVIVDDICDGGRTFVELGTKLKAMGANKVYLVVTHGIFSAGFDKLSEVLSGIYTTNSIREVKNAEGFVKQLNVF